MRLRAMQSSARPAGARAASPGPVASVAPAISGSGAVGSVRTSTSGSWTGAGPITYAYQWRRGGVDIAGATATSYTLVPADIGKSISCSVTATGADGSTSAVAPAVVPRLDASAKTATLMDSMGQYADNWVTASNYLRNTALGEIHHALMAAPSLRYIVWPDATNATGESPDRVSTYGDTTRGATGDIKFSGANFSYAGETATGSKDRVTAVINSGAKLCVVNLGTNIGSTDASAATTIAALTWIINALIGAGIVVVIGTIRPRRVVASGATGYDLLPADMARIVTINDWIRASAGGLGAIVWDPWADMVDPAYPLGNALYGNPKAGLLRSDGVHFVRGGAQTAAQSLIPILQGLQASNAPWFDADPVTLNLLSNGRFTGTSGTASTGATGTVPTGWVLSNTSGAGQPVTVASSLEANAATGGQTLILDITSTGAGAHGVQEIRLAHTPAINVATAGLASTDWVANAYELEMLAGNTIMAAIECVMLNGTSTFIAQSGNGFNTNRADDPLTNAAVAGYDGTFRVPALVGAATTLNTRLSLFVKTDVAGTQRIKVKRALAKKVSDPVAQFPWAPV